jgi:hypothetical protein
MSSDNSAFVMVSSRNYTSSIFVPCPMDMFESMRIDPGFQRVFVLFIDRMVNNHHLG